MSKITIKSENNSSFTLVPDAFIDRFMAGANGEYIKVYLYILNALKSDSAFGISEIADALEKEEADILRALRYWEKKGVFSLQTNEKSIESIYIKNLNSDFANTAPTRTTLTKTDMEKAFKSSHSLPTDSEAKEIPEDVSLLITSAERYFNRTLTMTDKNIILYMYDDLGLSFELIDYLFCRAVESGKTKLRYIEKIALDLHENEIKTVNSAKAHFSEGSQIVNTVMKAFGLQSRLPTTAEQKFIKKWADTLGFDKDLIEEACSRSALNTNSGNFQYADKILMTWHEEGVQSYSDIERLDAKHKAAAAKAPSKKSPSAKPTGFHNFEQRGVDIDDLEKKLLSE